LEPWTDFTRESRGQFRQPSCVGGIRGKNRSGALTQVRLKVQIATLSARLVPVAARNRRLSAQESKTLIRVAPRGTYRPVTRVRPSPFRP